MKDPKADLRNIDNYILFMNPTVGQLTKTTFFSDAIYELFKIILIIRPERRSNETCQVWRKVSSSSKMLSIL